MKNSDLIETNNVIQLSIQKQLCKWELFHARNYLSLMWPCFLMAKLNGLFPYRIITNKFISSKLGYIISIAFIIGYIFLLGFILYHMDVTGQLQYDSPPGILQGHSYLLLGFVITLTTYFHCHKRMMIFNEMLKISLQITPKYFSRLSKLIHTKDLFGFFFLLSQIPNLYSVTYLLFLSKILGMYTTIVIFLSDTIYVDCVLIIGLYFDNLREKLKKLQFNIENSEPHMLRRIYHIKYNPIILSDLQLIMREHNNLSSLITQLNNTFSTQLIASNVLTFAEITFSLYFYILQIHGNKLINLEKQIWSSYFITSVGYYAIKLILMVWACEYVKSQIDRVKNNIHIILNKSNDNEIIEQLRIFLLQYLHRENSFHAKGLGINALLLTSIIGGITTYLLILIQFLVASRKPQDSHDNDH